MDKNMLNEKEDELDKIKESVNNFTRDLLHKTNMLTIKQ